MKLSALVVALTAAATSWQLSRSTNAPPENPMVFSIGKNPKHPSLYSTLGLIPNTSVISAPSLSRQEIPYLGYRSVCFIAFRIATVRTLTVVTRISRPMTFSL